MTQMAITDKELIAALRRMAPETCLGCGHERSCNIHGCAVLRAAVRRLEELTAPPPNDPLTLDELREMDGEPVWVENANGGRYEVISFCRDGFTRFTDGSQPPDDMYGKSWLAYRRKPEKVSQTPAEPAVPDWAAHLQSRFLRAE